MLTQTILVDPNFQKPQLLLDTLGTGGSFSTPGADPKPYLEVHG